MKWFKRKVKTYINLDVGQPYQFKSHSNFLVFFAINNYNGFLGFSNDVTFRNNMSSHNST